MLLFSPTAGGFFDPAIHVAIPHDAVAVNPQRHAELLLLQSQGATIVPGADGAPIALARAGPGRDELYALMREQRSALLAACDWTQMADSPLTEAEQQAWRAYRQALRDLPEATTDPAVPAWPQPPERIDA